MQCRITIWRAWIFSLALLSGAALAGEASRSAPLRVVTDDNYPPYVFRTDDGGVAGYLVDYWKLWQEKTGVPVSLQATDWSGALRRLRDGEADVIDLIYRTPAREALYDFSSAYADVPVAIYRHAAIAGITDAASLKGFEIGVQAGDACIDELHQRGIASLVEYPNYAQLIEAAERSEIKVFCLDEHPANFYLYKHKVERDYLKAFTLYTGHAHRAVRKGDQATLQLVEQGMRRIGSDELRKLDEKWLGTRSPFAKYASVLVAIAVFVAGAGLALFVWNLTLRRRVAARTCELERATAAEKDARASLTATLQAIPDLLFEVDREHRYVGVYASSERQLYVPKSEMIGRRIGDVLPQDAAATVDAAIDAALAQGADYGRVIALGGEGETHWFELSLTRKGQGEAASVVMLSRDISARRQAAAALLKAREASLQAERDRLFRTLFDAMPVAVTFVQDESIVFVNRCFSELFGYARTDVEELDTWWLRAYPDPDYRAEVRQRWAAACAAADSANGRIEALEYRIAGAGGDVHDVLVGGQFVEDGMLATFTEITSQKQAEAALRQARDSAQAASQAKSAFLANMSHEIRTPLNAIIGLSTLLARAIDDPAQRDRVGKVLAAGQHLLDIINAILDLSKIEAGKFSLDTLPLRIDAIVGDVVELLAERAREKRIELRSELPALPTTLVGDSVRLKQALLNYASNAVKFTETGSVTIRVEVLEDNASASWLRFSVNDTGIGIADDVLPRLFAAFEQGDNSTTRRYGGSGLGLAITRKLAQIMGGDAGAQSVLGQGSTFWFSVRLAHGSSPVTVEPQDRHVALRAICAGRRVLLAEDEPINREITCALLEDLGLAVDTADDGRQAVTLASAGRYALLLMDMQMPDMDGLEATRTIRRLPGYAHCPIVALTANAYAEDRERCFDAGMTGFVSKPIDPVQLYAALHSALQAGV